MVNCCFARRSIPGLTDALDGFIAKRFNAVTKLGAILDPLADKALLVSSYVMLTLMGIVPFWLTVAVVFRDIVIVGGYLIILLFFTSDGLDEVKTSPLKISKLNTFLQIAFIVFVLSALSWSFELPMFTQIFSYVVLVTSVLSGAMYVFIGSMQATKYSESANE